VLVAILLVGTLLWFPGGDAALAQPAATPLGEAAKALAQPEMPPRGENPDIASLPAPAPVPDGAAESEPTVASTVAKSAADVWNSELLGEEVTVSKLVQALIILAIGFLLSRRVARKLHQLTVERFKVEKSVAAPIEKAVFYILLIMVVLFALSVVDIPLTIFAYMGGAVAIGVGFGAQNLINNFISGLIILLERPVKVGDIVDVDGVRGRIAAIGARCSQVKLFDGVDILVPNSAFLEKNVVNWTLSDSKLRFSVSVGAVYGSSAREVADLMETAVTEHPEVLSTPEPQIIFEDFGDDALLFTAYFWLEVTRPMDYRVVASDIRFRIDALFEEAGVSMAFPQRDVHLDSAKPLQVQVIPGGSEGNAPEQDS
jgi:potassium-dependent mechanosensitive channel